MITLGIESTAHTFGIGVLKGGRILADERSVYRPEKGGIVPVHARDHHRKNYESVYSKALNKAKINEKDIGLVAFSKGPGLGPCLRVGFDFARELSARLKAPLIGANHCIAHIEVGKKTSGLKDPLTLYVSGGNTQIIGLESGKYRIFGETLDIAVGKCIDHFAREAGFPSPAGPKIEELAKGGSLIILPYTVKGMDFSFSGILTAASRMVGKEKLEDICFSLQEYSFAMLTEATERALAHTGKKECLLTGGVAANKRLQEMLATMCRARNVKFRTVPKEYAGDNGAMIGLLGYLMHKAGVRQPKPEVDIQQRFRTDEVDVVW